MVKINRNDLAGTYDVFAEPWQTKRRADFRRPE